MKRIVSLLLFIGIALLSSLSYAYGPGTTQPFNPALTNGIQALEYAVYNSHDNQYLFSWLSKNSEIRYEIYTATGTLITENLITPSSQSSPAAAYNSADNQYIVAWIGGGGPPAFSILDAQGNILVSGMSITIAPGLVINGDIFCCYNSVNNQYCLTWTAQNAMSESYTYFAILNADGSIAQGSTAIPPLSGELTLNSTDSFVTYNAQNNQYFFTWLGATGDAIFALYDAQGNQIIPATLISEQYGFTSTTYPIFTCYNSFTNQYFITWVASLGMAINQGFFAIYNASGSIAVPATKIPTPILFASPPVCSYNIRTNQYFVSWRDGNMQALCAIYDANGNALQSQVVIPTLSAGEPAAWVFNAVCPQDNTYFITWYSPGGVNAYFNLFTVAPSVAAPARIEGQHRLNRFANYGEYVTQISWTPSNWPLIASYSITRDGAIVGTVPASSPFYIGHNQPRSPITYGVQAVNVFGDVSEKIRITL